MKKYIKGLLLALLPCMGACTAEDFYNEDVLDKGNEITEIEAIATGFDISDLNTRTAITMGNNSIENPVWADNDTIGIYPTEGDQLSFPIVDGVGTSKCVFNGGGWALKTSTAYTAYSPFNRNYYYKNSNELPVSMLGQKQVGNNNSSHLGAYDIQIAKGTTPSSGKISFTFAHQVAIVRLDLTAPREAEWSAVVLESDALFTTEAKMNLAVANPTLTSVETSNSIRLDLDDVVTTSSNMDIIAYMMMLPVDLTNKDLVVKLIDNEGIEYITTATITNSNHNFAASSARWITADNFKMEGVEVHVATAGKLSSLISAEDKYNITTLTLTGNINSDDIAFIRAMAGFSNSGAKTDGKLVRLDLSGCNIVSGGSGYYSHSAYYTYDKTSTVNDGYSTYTTSDNVLPDCVFAKTNLTTVVLPSTITAIDSQAFYGAKLKSVTIPASVLGFENIGLYGQPFGYSEIENIYVAYNHPALVSINGLLYNKNTMQLIACPGGRKEVVLPTNITSIGNRAFCGTIYLTNVNIPKGVTFSGTTKIFYLSSITSAIIPEGTTEIPQDMFFKCFNLSYATIPEGVERIHAGNFAFSSLESVTLPSTISEIDFDAFSNISTLEEVHIKATTPPWSTGSAVFGGTSKTNCILYVPIGSLNAYKNADVWKDFADIREE